MPPITKQAAILKLRKLIEQSNSIQDGTSAHIGWNRTMNIAVERILGEHSSQINEIQRVSSLLHQSALLKSMAEEIEEYWDENEPSIEPADSTPRHPVTPTNAQNPRKIFVVHGRNGQLRVALFQFLRSIGLNPVEWSQAIKDTGKASPYIGEVLDTAFSKAQAVVVLMTPDDKAFLSEELRTPKDPPYETQPTPQARPNVLFEAGMAMGWSSARTVLVEVGDLRPFSDVGGRHVLKLNNSTERRQELAQRLESAGCLVDLSGTDWHREGDFNSE